MNNLILFVNSLLSQLVLFGLIVVLVIVAVFAGVTLRKSKDKKEAALAAETGGTEE